MNTVTYKKDAPIYKVGEQMMELGLIVRGAVRQETKESVIVLEAGHLIGLVGCDQCVYLADYYAHEDTVIYAFPYKKTDDLDVILTSQKEYGSVFILAALKQAYMYLEKYQRQFEVAKKLYITATETVRSYKYLCTKYGIPEQIFSRIDFLVPLDERHNISKWKKDYYEQFCKLGLDELKGLFTTKELCIGTIFQTGQMMVEVLNVLDEIETYIDVHKTLLLAPRRNDLYQLMFDLEIKAALIGKGKEEVAEQLEKISDFINQSEIFDINEVREREEEHCNYDFANVTDVSPMAERSMNNEVVDIEGGNNVHLNNSLDQILRFAEEKPEDMLEFRNKIAEYRELKDPYSTDEEVRRLRRNISTAFYRVYKSCVKRVLTRGETTRIVELFLNFGYMDAAVLGDSNAEQLEKLLDRLFLCKSDNLKSYEILSSRKRKERFD